VLDVNNATACCADTHCAAPRVHSFTELYVGETTSREDLCTIVAAALAGVPRAPVDDVVDFYTAALREADTSLLDSAGQKPQYRCALRCAPARAPPAAGFCDDTSWGSAALCAAVKHPSLVIS
jgi:hypothetical protein